jgi:hypothetical protein
MYYELSYDEKFLNDYKDNLIFLRINEYYVLKEYEKDQNLWTLTTMGNLRFAPLFHSELQ